MGKRWAIVLGVPVLALAVAGGTDYAPDRAHAAQVSCGDTITADTTLDSDLVDCPNNGIVIGADDVTLDLNGHLIDGDGTSFAGCPEDEFCDVGVLNDGHDGVTVTHGSVREFGDGVFVGKARDNRVLGISSSTNVFFGFVVAESARSLVRDSSGNDNLAPEGDGMGLFGSHDVRIVDNSFRHNPLGLHVEDSTDNLIKGNVFSRNGIIMQADRNRVRRNRFVDGAGIFVETGSRNVIARNRVQDRSGIGIEEGRGNVVARNVVVDARRSGIVLGFQDLAGGAHNVVRRNLVRGSGNDAFLVNVKDNHSVLRRNVAVGAGDDGFDVESHSAKLTRNRAVRNRDLGIEAVVGVTDGGGNGAHGNGNPAQCTYVGCS